MDEMNSLAIISEPIPGNNINESLTSVNHNIKLQEASKIYLDQPFITDY